MPTERITLSTSQRVKYAASQWPYDENNEKNVALNEKALLLELIAEYVGNMKEGHARVRMEEVRQAPIPCSAVTFRRRRIESTIPCRCGCRPHALI